MTSVSYSFIFITLINYDALMKHAALINPFILESSSRVRYSSYAFLFFAGLLGPLSFAPFHLPGLIIISLAFLYATLFNCDSKRAFTYGFIYGMGYFGLGVSWVIVSIHDYGQLNYVLAGMATLAFIAYLAIFPALVSYLFTRLAFKQKKLLNIMLFSALWCLSEAIRSTLFTGFPWLLTGTPLIDTPLKYGAPLIGIYGLSLVCTVLGGLLAQVTHERSVKRFYYIGTLALILIAPKAGQYIHWTKISNDPVSIGIVQANLSMRDKWDEALFWKLLKYYERTTAKLMGKQLIILPESAIPLPASYLEDYLNKLHYKALKAKSSLILGILQPTDNTETSYYNSIISLGMAKGEHTKIQLVPFGEYIPKPFIAINHWLNLPEPNIVPGKRKQSLMSIANHPVASLICYEIAYPNLLRKQMPEAQWIVSISDNGWFGRSLASYQQLQMAQILSLLTSRYQIVVNNDGLSSIINEKGEIIDSLPPFASGTLEGTIFSAQGITPWIVWNELPSIIFCSLILIYVLFLQIRRFTS